LWAHVQVGGANGWFGGGSVVTWALLLRDWRAYTAFIFMEHALRLCHVKIDQEEGKVGGSKRVNKFMTARVSSCAVHLQAIDKRQGLHHKPTFQRK